MVGHACSLKQDHVSIVPLTCIYSVPQRYSVLGVPLSPVRPSGHHRSSRRWVDSAAPSLSIQTFPNLPDLLKLMEVNNFGST